MLICGFLLGFFVVGILVSFGVFFNELYLSGICGIGVGFCYNFGCVVLVGFLVLVGYMSDFMLLG